MSGWTDKKQNRHIKNKRTKKSGAPQGGFANKWKLKKNLMLLAQRIENCFAPHVLSWGYYFHRCIPPPSSSSRRLPPPRHHIPIITQSTSHIQHTQPTTHSQHHTPNITLNFTLRHHTLNIRPSTSHTQTHPTSHTQHRQPTSHTQHHTPNITHSTTNPTSHTQHHTLNITN